MNCKYVLNNLHEFIYNELDSETSENIKNHISCCSKCFKEYTNLKKLLVSDIEELNILKNSMIPSKNLYKKVHRTLKEKPCLRKKYIMAASLLFIFLTTVTSVNAYLNRNNSLEKYKLINKNIIKRFNNGEGTIINKSCTMNNIKFTVDAMITEKKYITLLYSVKLLKPTNCNFALPSKIYIQDDFGFKEDILSDTGTFETIPKDNESKFICSFKKPSIISNKIKVRVTCFNKGLYINNQHNKNSYKEFYNAYGNWYLEFKLP